MRIPLVVANWKMHKTVLEAVAFTKECRSLVDDIGDVEIVVAPPYTAIHAVAEAARNSNIGVGAQNVYWERDGAFTGEIAAGMLAEAGAKYVIIGHSERRRLFNESDATVNRRIKAALGAGLTPLVCIGETLEEREAGATLLVLDRQIRDGLESLTGQEIQQFVLAYEPVWAIGTGRTATPEQAQEAHAHIRTRLRQWFGADAAERCRILYGGSVKPDNIRDLARQPDVDGALVGGASLDLQSFHGIVTGSRPRPL